MQESQELQAELDNLNLPFDTAVMIRWLSSKETASQIMSNLTDEALAAVAETANYEQKVRQSAKEKIEVNNLAVQATALGFNVKTVLQQLIDSATPKHIRAGILEKVLPSDLWLLDEIWSRMDANMLFHGSQKEIRLHHGLTSPQISKVFDRLLTAGALSKVANDGSKLIRGHYQVIIAAN